MYLLRLSLVLAQLDAEHDACARILGSNGISRLGFHVARVIRPRRCPVCRDGACETKSYRCGQ